LPERMKRVRRRCKIRVVVVAMIVDPRGNYAAAPEMYIYNMHACLVAPKLHLLLRPF
jgi:hypothetical protein